MRRLLKLPVYEKISITFKVHGGRRHYVDTKKIHHSQKTKNMISEFGMFTIDLIPNRELYSHLLSFGGDLEIISPKVVRDKMKEHAENLTIRYQ